MKKMEETSLLLWTENCTFQKIVNGKWRNRLKKNFVLFDCTLQYFGSPNIFISQCILGYYVCSLNYICYFKIYSVILDVQVPWACPRCEQSGSSSTLELHHWPLQIVRVAIFRLAIVSFTLINRIIGIIIKNANCDPQFWLWPIRLII